MPTQDSGRSVAPGGASSAWTHPRADAQPVANYVDRVNADPRVAALRTQAHDALEPLPGRAVLDVGCGTGTDCIELVQRGANTVIGVDHSASMVSETRQRSQGAVLVARSDIRALPFADHAFDTVRAIRVLMHVREPEHAVREMVRVLKPGGRILLSEPDWFGFTISPGTPEEVVALREAYSTRIITPDAGRRLATWLHRAGCVDLDVNMTTVVLNNRERIIADFGLDTEQMQRIVGPMWRIPAHPNAATDLQADTSEEIALAWNPSITVVATRSHTPSHRFNVDHGRGLSR